MKYCLLALVAAMLIATAISCCPCCSEKPCTANSSTAKEPDKKDVPLLLEDDAPLLLEDDAPLLLDDPADHGDADMADNSRCFVCHINYAQEKIALVHARKDMGCVHCHGVSDEHIADESWASGGNGTAPDKIFTKDQINPFCMGCHPGRDLPKKEHRILFTNPPPDKYCTDCHGDHLLPERKTKWK
ncbi:MAG: multiheme c-type cytochrome [Planctomycetota bacterium]